MGDEIRTELSYENAIYWAKLDVREKDVLGEVSAEREDGKPKFGNEQSRKAELTHRLEMDSTYQHKRAELAMLVRENMYLQREAKFAGKIVEIMCTFSQKQQEPLIPVPASLLAELRPQAERSKPAVHIPRFDNAADDEDDVSAA